MPPDVRFYGGKNAPNSLSAGAPPQTPLGELTALPRLNGPTSKARGGKGGGGKQGRKGKGKGKGKKIGRGDEVEGEIWPTQKFWSSAPLCIEQLSERNLNVAY